MERLKNIAVVVGLLLSITTLYNWGSKLFSHELKAHLEAGAFAIPPQLDSFYSKLAAGLTQDAFAARALGDDSFKSIYFPKDTPDEQKASVVRRIAGFLPSAGDLSIPYDFKSIESLWTGTVVNSQQSESNGGTTVPERRKIRFCSSGTIIRQHLNPCRPRQYRRS